MQPRHFHHLASQGPLHVDDPPEDQTQTDDTTKSGTLPTPGADEPLAESTDS